MVRATVDLKASPLRRTVVRSSILLALVIVAAATWFALLPLTPAPQGPVVAAATDPSNATTHSGSGLTPAPSASARASATTPPTATPTPAASANPRIASLIIASATTATRNALTARLGALRATYGLPGVSAAILFADGTMWRATSGFADVSARRRLTADTEFAIASVSKTFLAALILKLAEDGALVIDAPVTAYLPELAIDSAITVRELLDHTSGLHDYFYDPTIDEALLAEKQRVWTAQETLAYVGKPYFKPGTGWHYSNTNYLVLGLLAEKVGGAPLAEQLHARFLTPLALGHTYYQGVDEPVGPLARAYRFDGPGLRRPPLSLGDGTDVVPFTSVVTAAGSAGSIASTATDLARWARALYGGEILAPPSLAAMVADVAVTAPFKPSIPYGLGVQAATIDGRPTFGHSGRFLGSRTVVRWLPEQGIAIAVLSNQSRYDPNLVVRGLLRVVLGTPPVCTGCPATN
jgi:D-alanyl-D-alanine carboxypeptidase